MLFHVGREHDDLATARGFLRFPMSLPDKARFVRLMLRAFATRDWSGWEGRSAADMIDTLAGPGVRKTLFEPLTRLKFELPCEQVSGAWLGTRLYYREGSAALGYIPNANWTKTLCDGLTRLITAAGVTVLASQSVVKLHTRDDAVLEAQLADGRRIGADLFVSTMPTEVYTRLLSDCTPGLSRIRYTALLSVVSAIRRRLRPDFYWMNLASTGHTAGAIFVLSSLNPTIGEPGETCVNFVTHLNGRHRQLFDLPDDQLLARYAEDFERVLGAKLQPVWTHVSRVPMYSPVFDTDWRNPPVRSVSWRNLYFAGNYRTFPSVASTGTALQSGVEAGDALLHDIGGQTDLPTAIERFRLPRSRRFVS
jgi:protoporphyrinogen oxidase